MYRIISIYGKIDMSGILKILELRKLKLVLSILKDDNKLFKLHNFTKPIET